MKFKIRHLMALNAAAVLALGAWFASAQMAPTDLSATPPAATQAMAPATQPVTPVAVTATEAAQMANTTQAAAMDVPATQVAATQIATTQVASTQIATTQIATTQGSATRPTGFVRGPYYPSTRPGFGGFRPTTGPFAGGTTMPTTAAMMSVWTRMDFTGTVPPMSPEFQPVLDRSIFIRGIQTTARPVFDPNAVRPPGPTPPPPTVTTILTGVMKVNGEYTAYLENRSTGETLRAHVGEGLYFNKVLAIDLSGMDLDRNGKTIHVNVGNNLEAPPPVLVSAAPTTTPSTNPAFVDSAGRPMNTANMSVTDIVEQLRRRRQQQLGQ